ncbi:hypothetical protein [Nostoc sp. NMS9]|uniref:hypothetical protein n=1 Tax=Nostoc sp. NMS9 TaxID=2815393 RepID=UPI0025D290AD|nr:hypothetical protein [Nostoc sp. NMS9]MBN3943237.1 hypothetical protein [Nostoc sp. NMS9]
MKILNHKNGINYHKDAINRRLYNNQSFVETAIHRVSCVNRKVLPTLRSMLGFTLLNPTYI